jgi:acyl-coenzyme A thioesterase PaaI-like protein
VPRNSFAHYDKFNHLLNDTFAPKVPQRMDKKSFLRWAGSGWPMRMFLFRRLPSAWFMGIRVVRADEASAVVALPYGWRSQNPFRSIYFAAQCAAAELSTGVLAMAALHGEALVSMLVTDIRATFLKKASETLLFECVDGKLAQDTVRQALASDDAQLVTMNSIGRLPDGTIAVRVEITWSFKQKKRLN